MVLSVLCIITGCSGTVSGQQESIKVIAEEVLLDDLPITTRYFYRSDTNILLDARWATRWVQEDQKNAVVAGYIDKGLKKLPDFPGPIQKFSEKILRSRYHVAASQDGRVFIRDLQTGGMNTFRVKETNADEIAIWDINEQKGLVGYSTRFLGEADKLYLYNTKTGETQYLTNGLGMSWDHSGSLIEYKQISDGNIPSGERLDAGKISIAEYEQLTGKKAPETYWVITKGPGSEKLVLTDFPRASYALWSPKGDYLYISSRYHGDYVVEIEHKDTLRVANTYKILDNEMEVDYAVWSPDGQYLVYSMFKLDPTGHTYIGSDIDLIRFDGSEHIRLHEGGSLLYEDPVWLEPNTLIFSRLGYKAGSKEIVKLTLTLN